jgi:hypothetical protein
MNNDKSQLVSLITVRIPEGNRLFQTLCRYDTKSNYGRRKDSLSLRRRKIFY